MTTLPLTYPETLAEAKPRAATAKVRIRYIDFARGFLFLLMTSAHSAELVQLPEESFFSSELWLPRGGSFQTFIVLSGFTAACVFDWRRTDPSQLRRRLFRRAMQVLTVMFISNVVMLILSLIAKHEMGTLRDPWWWIGLFTLHTRYSISGVLLPTALMLFILPAVYGAWKRSPWITGASVLLASMLAWQATLVWGDSFRQNHLLDVLMVSGAGGFPIVPLICYGLSGFVMGQIWKDRPVELGVTSFLLLVLPFVALETAHGRLGPVVDFLYGGLAGPARLAACLALGMLCTLPSRPWNPTVFLPLIGQYALFSFVMHRIVLQGLGMTLGRWIQGLTPDSAYLLYFIGTMIGVALLCLVRSRVRFIDRALVAIYL